jgi:hypothetical protein
MLDKNQKKKLKKQISKKNLAKRNSRYEYLGLLNEYQLYGKKLKSRIYLYNETQALMLRELIHGHGAYRDDQEKFDNLSKKQKKEISVKWFKAKKEINNLKQILIHKKCNDFMEKVFGNFFPKHVEQSKNLWNTQVIDRNVIYVYNPSELGIYYDHLILLFIKKKLLPENFFELA